MVQNKINKILVCKYKLCPIKLKSGIQGLVKSGIDTLGSITASVATVVKPPVFKTPAPEGCFRDEVVVEFLTLNGSPYLGTVTHNWTYNYIMGPVTIGPIK